MDDSTTTIDNRNDAKTVDILLKECEDLIDPQYTPYFAKRFYWFDKDSVLKAASIARADGKSPQKNLTHFVKTAELEEEA